MSTYQITLYKNCKILKDNNFVIDELNTYLGSLTASTPAVINYKRLSNLVVSVRLEMSQVEVNPMNTLASNFNYAKLVSWFTTNEAATSYYFITKKKWISSSAVEFELTLDTLNSCRNLYTLSAKTRIIREHRDRFNSTPTTSGGTSYIRNLQINGEGVTPPLYQRYDTKLNEEEYLAKDWYLAFQTSHFIDTEDPLNPISMLLIPSSAVLMRIPGSSTNTLGLTDFSSVTKSIFILRTKNNTGSITTGGVTYHLGDLSGSGSSEVEIIGFEISLNLASPSSYLTVQKIEMHTQDDTIKLVETVLDNAHSAVTINEIVVNGYLLDYSTIGSETEQIKYTAAANTYDDFMAKILNKADIIYTHVEAHSTSISSLSISSYDRTDARVMKVIQLPYCPVSNSDLTSKFALDTDGFISWNFKADLNPNLERSISMNITTSSFLDKKIANLSGIDRNDLYTDSYFWESQLFHSDYCRFKIAYDSFSYVFQIELLTNNTGHSAYTIKMKTSTTMSSAFLFKFDDYTTLNYKIEDYQPYLIINRNNELPIYSNSYVDYVRTGYNYDIKAKKREETMTALGVGLNLVGSAGAVASGNVALSVGMATSAFSQLASAVNSIVGAEQSLAQKKAELRMQTSSVNTSDDLDLMNYYAGNKLRYLEYYPSDKVRNVLRALFHYTGYNINELGIPDTTTRYWFNYLQADIVFESVKNLTQEILDDLKAKYSIGITVFHYHSLTPSYDLEQEKENWETFLL